MEFLFISLIKIVAIVLYVYALLRVMGSASTWVKLGGIVVAFALIQAAFIFQPGGVQILNDFDKGLLIQSCTITMVALGLNLIYGFNGQFSLGQYGFYAIGAYAAADVTYRWNIGDPRGLIGLTLLVLLVAVSIWGVRRFLSTFRGVPVLSAFTLYLLGTIVAVAIAVVLTALIIPAVEPLFGTADAPGILRSWLAMQITFFFAVLLAGAVAAEIAFLFGLPVLTLGSDYFGIATLGFTIVVGTLLVNSDTILPFAEMRGGRGMIGIPKLSDTIWFWAFLFLLLTIVVLRNLVYSSTGRAITSVREDETAAKVMGISRNSAGSPESRTSWKIPSTSGFGKSAK